MFQLRSERVKCRKYYISFRSSSNPPVFFFFFWRVERFDLREERKFIVGSSLDSCLWGGSFSAVGENCRVLSGTSDTERYMVRRSCDCKWDIQSVFKTVITFSVDRCVKRTGGIVSGCCQYCWPICFPTNYLSAWQQFGRDCNFQSMQLSRPKLSRKFPQQ